MEWPEVRLIEAGAAHDDDIAGRSTEGFRVLSFSVFAGSEISFPRQNYDADEIDVLEEVPVRSNPDGVLIVSRQDEFIQVESRLEEALRHASEQSGLEFIPETKEEAAGIEILGRVELFADLGGADDFVAVDVVIHLRLIEQDLAIGLGQERNGDRAYRCIIESLDYRVAIEGQDLLQALLLGSSFHAAGKGRGTVLRGIKFLDGNFNGTDMGVLANAGNDTGDDLLKQDMAFAAYDILGDGRGDLVIEGVLDGVCQGGLTGVDVYLHGDSEALFVVRFALC